MTHQETLTERECTMFGITDFQRFSSTLTNTATQGRSSPVLARAARTPVPARFTRRPITREDT